MYPMNLHVADINHTTDCSETFLQPLKPFGDNCKPTEPHQHITHVIWLPHIKFTNQCLACHELNKQTNKQSNICFMFSIPSLPALILIIAMYGIIYMASTMASAMAFRTFSLDG